METWLLLYDRHESEPNSVKHWSIEFQTTDLTEKVFQRRPEQQARRDTRSNLSQRRQRENKQTDKIAESVSLTSQKAGGIVEKPVREILGRDWATLVER